MPPSVTKSWGHVKPNYGPRRKTTARYAPELQFAGAHVPADKKVENGRVRDESCTQIADRAVASVIPTYTPNGKLVKSLAVLIGTFSA